MYYLQTKASFDAAHFLWKYEGKCRNIHGHRWNVVAKIKSQELEQEGQTRGMVVDFGNLKKDLKVLCDYFDHSLIYETGNKSTLRPGDLFQRDFHRHSQTSERMCSSRNTGLSYGSIDRTGGFPERTVCV